MSEYVVSDPHGHKDLVDYALKKISFDEEKDRLYIVGDAIDRGKDGIKLLQKFMEKPNTYNLILGNHEFMMLNSVDPYGSIALPGPKARIWTEYNGGNKTYNQWLNLLSSERQEIFSYLYSCPISKTVIVSDRNGNKKPYILTHSSYYEEMDDMPYKEAVKELGIEPIESAVWCSVFRTGDTKGQDTYFKKIDNEEVMFITGHVPVQKARLFLHQDKDFGEFSPLCFANRMLDIDGGAAWGYERGVKTGLLFYNLNTQEAIPVSFYDMKKGV